MMSPEAAYNVISISIDFSNLLPDRNSHKYSLWGSSPRPMDHKTIALTTELRELLESGIDIDKTGLIWNGNSNSTYIYIYIPQNWD